jgi:hypothetical protein
VSFGDADLAMMLGDAFSGTVSWGSGPSAVSTTGIEDFHDIQQFDDDGGATVVGRARGVTLLTSLVGSLTDGVAITVNGTARVVRGQPIAQSDGKSSLVLLRG